MTTTESDILAALRILQDAPNGLLHAHRDLTLQVWKHITSALDSTENEETGRQTHTFRIADGTGADHARLCEPTIIYPTLHDNDSSTGSPHIERNPSSISRYVSSPSRSTASDDVPPKKKRKRSDGHINRPLILLEAVKQHLPELEELSKKGPTLHHWLLNGHGDVRLEYIKRIDGNKTPNDTDRLLKAICQISLAQQFTSWERGRGWDSRVDELGKQIKAYSSSENPGEWKNGKRKGRVSQYVRDNGYPKSEHSVVIKAICRGTNQLVFMCLLKETLQRSSRAEVDGTFAAVTIFEYADFQALKVYEMPKFLGLLQKARYNDASRADKSESLIQRLCNVTAWSQSLQSNFESIFKGYVQGPQNGSDPGQYLRPSLLQPTIKYHQHPVCCVTTPHDQGDLCRTLENLPTTEHQSLNSTSQVDLVRNSSSRSSIERRARFETLVSAACSTETAGQFQEGEARITAVDYISPPVHSQETLLDFTTLDFVDPFLDVNDLEFVDSPPSMFPSSEHDLLCLRNQT